MNIFLTGRPQSGKSTVIDKTLALLPPLKLGGFRTVTRPSDIPGALGELYIQPAAAPPCYDRWHLAAIRWGAGQANVFPETFEQAGLALLQAIPRDSALLIMDELGVMENAAPGFCRAVLSLLDSGLPILGVIKPKPGLLLDAVRAHPLTRLVEVTRDNRDALPALLATEIAARLRP